MSMNSSLVMCGYRSKSSSAYLSDEETQSIFYALDLVTCVTVRFIAQIFCF